MMMMMMMILLRLNLIHAFYMLPIAHFVCVFIEWVVAWMVVVGNNQTRGCCTLNCVFFSPLFPYYTHTIRTRCSAGRPRLLNPLQTPPLSACRFTMLLLVNVKSVTDDAAMLLTLCITACSHSESHYYFPLPNNQMLVGLPCLGLWRPQEQPFSPFYSSQSVQWFQTPTQTRSQTKASACCDDCDINRWVHVKRVCWCWRSLCRPVIPMLCCVVDDCWLYRPRTKKYLMMIFLMKNRPDSFDKNFQCCWGKTIIVVHIGFPQVIAKSLHSNYYRVRAHWEYIVK